MDFPFRRYSTLQIGPRVRKAPLLWEHQSDDLENPARRDRSSPRPSLDRSRISLGNGQPDGIGFVHPASLKPLAVGFTFYQTNLAQSVRDFYEYARIDTSRDLLLIERALPRDGRRT